MKSVLFVVLSLLLGGVCYAQRYIDTDSSFHVTHVRFDLTIPRIDTEYLEGSVRLRCVSKGLNVDNRIELRLHRGLTVDSVFGAVGSSLKYSHTDDTLYVTVEKQYPAGQLFDVTVFYHGLDRSGGFIHAYQVWPPNGQERLSPPVEWTGAEPFSAHYWWPCHENPADKIDSADLYISCAKHWNVASNGSLRAVTQRDTFNTFWWHEAHPIDHYLLAFSITDYDTIGWWHRWADGDSTRIQNFIFPRSRDTMQNTLHWIDTILDQYDSWFGPYAFRDEKYGICQWHGGGMENQTLSFCNDADVELLAHETAHQWFGDAVTCKTWEDCWLNEGFATYVSDRFMRRVSGESAFDTSIFHEEQYVIGAPDGAVHAQPGVLDTFPDDYPRGKRVLDGRLVYNKGGLVLHMLNFVLGSDSAFFHAIRHYVTGPKRYGVVTTEDLRAAVEEWSGKDLKWFFDEWVYDEGYPIYSVAWSEYDSAVSVAISQSQSSQKSPVFRMPIELRFVGNRLDTSVIVWNDRSLQSYVFHFDRPVDHIQFDPHNYLLDGAAPQTLDVRENVHVQSKLKIERVTGDMFLFDLPVTANDVSIYSTTGELLQRELVAPGNTSITLDLRLLPNGAYFVRSGGQIAAFAICR
jgi:aminopeptidase N